MQAPAATAAIMPVHGLPSLGAHQHGDPGAGEQQPLHTSAPAVVAKAAVVRVPGAALAPAAGASAMHAHPLPSAMHAHPLPAAPTMARTHSAPKPALAHRQQAPVPVDRETAIKVLNMLESKFNDIYAYQSKLLARIREMSERIAEKDALISALQKAGAAAEGFCAAAHADAEALGEQLQEREQLSGQLSKLRLQMLDAQQTMEAAAETGKSLAK
jgi:hypothetical protein